jgi:hypothetical protein
MNDSALGRTLGRSAARLSHPSATRANLARFLTNETFRQLL